MWYWGNDVAFFIQKAETKTACLWRTHTHKHTLLWVYHRHVSIQQQSFFLHQGFLDYQLTSTTTSWWEQKISPTQLSPTWNPNNKNPPLLIDMLPLFWRVEKGTPKIFRTSPSSHRCPGPVPGHKLPKLHPNLRASRSGDLTGKSQNGERRKRGVFFGWSSYNKPNNIFSYMKNPSILSQM